MPRVLLWLILGTFAVGTGTFSIAGLLPVIAEDLDVSLPAAGHLSMAFALASPVLAAATAGMERRRTLAFGMAVYVLASGSRVWRRRRWSARCGGPRVVEEGTGTSRRPGP